MTREELLKIAKPILFNTEMVQAILEGRKTVTRRVVKLDLGLADTDKHDSSYLKIPDEYGDYHDAKDLCRYKIGDILYVRETGMIQSMKNFGKKVKILFKADNSLVEFSVSDEEYERLSKWELIKRWLSPYWLTKETARIFLKVTDVRVERLQDITVGDIENEGYPDEIDFSTMPIAMQGIVFEWWANTWNYTIKKQDLDKYSWDSNPWVWAIEFGREEVE